MSVTFERLGNKFMEWQKQVFERQQPFEHHKRWFVVASQKMACLRVKFTHVVSAACDYWLTLLFFLYNVVG